MKPCFNIHGKEYGIAQPSGIGFRDDPTQVRLEDLHLRLKERFVYEYDFTDNWRHQLRLEHALPVTGSISLPFGNELFPVRLGQDACSPKATPSQ